MRGLLNQVRQPNLFLLFDTCPPRVCGSAPHPARPHRPVHWGVPTLSAPPPPRALGRVHTLRAHTAPCIGGTPCAPTIPCIGACSHPVRLHHPAHWGVSTHCAPTPPRALGVSTPCAPTSPRVCGSVLTLCAPSHPAHWGVSTPFAPTPPRALGRVHTLRAQPPRALGHTLCAHHPVHWSIHTLRTYTAPCIGACPHLPPPTISRMRGRANTLRAHTAPRIGGVFTLGAPTPTRVCGGVLTLCAPTPPRALGVHPERPPPRALGHTLHATSPAHWGTLCAPTPPPRIGACSHPSRHPLPLPFVAPIPTHAI